MNRMKIVLASAAALFAFCTVSAQTVNDVNAKYNEAVALIQSKKAAEAIAPLEEAIKMGEMVEGAETTLLHAKQALPRCYCSKAASEAQAGQLDAALADFNKAIEIATAYNNPQILLSAKSAIAKVYTIQAADAFNNKNYAQAAEIFAKGYAANPNDTELALNLAMSYCEMGDLAKGNEVYKNIIALSDKHSKYADDAATAKEKFIYYNMLDAAKKAGEQNYEGAVAVIDSMGTVVPLTADANMLLLQAYTNMKNYDKVIEIGEAAAAMQTTPEQQSDAYFLLGAAYQNKENYPAAIATYQKVTVGDNVATAKQQITALNAIKK